MLISIFMNFSESRLNLTEVENVETPFFPCSKHRKNYLNSNTLDFSTTLLLITYWLKSALCVLIPFGEVVKWNRAKRSNKRICWRLNCILSTDNIGKKITPSAITFFFLSSIKIELKYWQNQAKRWKVNKVRSVPVGTWLLQYSSRTMFLIAMYLLLLCIKVSHCRPWARGLPIPSQ